MHNEHAELPVGIGWFSPDSYERLRRIAADPENLAETFQAWESKAKEGLFLLRARGVDVHQFFVDVDDLERWCRQNDRPVDGPARAAYISDKLSRRDRTGSPFQ